MQLSNQSFHISKDSNRACMFLHGFGGCLVELSPLVELLKSKNLSLIANNYPGHDSYQDLMPHTTWQDWYESAKSTYLELEGKYEQVDIVAFSAGSLLAMILASEFKVNKLVLLSPFLMLNKSHTYFLPDELAVNLRLLFSEYAKRKCINLFDKSLEEQAAELVFNKSFNLKSLKSLIKLTKLVKVLIPKITNETIIFHSINDDTADYAGAKYLFKNLGSQAKQLIRLEKSKHSILLDYDRDLVIEKILEFLNYD